MCNRYRISAKQATVMRAYGLDPPDGSAEEALALVKPYDGPMRSQVETPRGNMIGVDA